MAIRKSSRSTDKKSTVKKGASGNKAAAAKGSLWRKLLLTASVLLIVAMIGGIVFFVCMIPQELVFKNPRFKLYKVEVKNGRWQGRGHELRQKLNIPIAANIFSLDVGKIREQCLKFSYVEDATVQLILPDMLIFEFKERHPRAIIDGDKFIDEKYVIFEQEEGVRVPHSLPVIIGDPSQRIAVSKAVDLIMTANRDWREITIKQVDISNPNQLEVILTTTLYEGDLNVTFPIDRNFGELFNELQNVIYQVYNRPDFDGSIILLRGRAIYGKKN